MENFYNQTLLDIMKEMRLELFQDPFGHLAAVAAPECHSCVEPCHVLDQRGILWKTFLTKVAKYNGRSWLRTYSKSFWTFGWS